MAVSARRRASVRKAAYGLLAFLVLVVVALSFVQLWFLYSATDLQGFGSVPADERGWPAADQRGAFLVLKENHNPRYEGNLLMLLQTTQPGVVDEQAGAHLLPEEIDYLLVQSAALSESHEYRVYRLGEADEEMLLDRQPGGKVLLIRPQDGVWDPGTYIVDIPAEGMFGGRVYFQFYVDPPE